MPCPDVSEAEFSVDAVSVDAVPVDCAAIGSVRKQQASSQRVTREMEIRGCRVRWNADHNAEFILRSIAKRLSD